ncbi:MAG: GNAT family N-acetyltransferase, partial [Planctomycetales bacterium]|nr:GNAT family N-acetyltransferase [Planctomycetales bacterium]
MPTTLISQVSELAPYLDRWRQWAPSPMQSPEWLLNWWQVYQTSASRLAVLLVHNSGGTLQGIAPFYFRDSWLQGRSVRFLGSGRVCSDFQSLLAAPGQHCLVAETVAQWLGSVTGEQRWDFVELQGIAADDEAISQLSVGFKQRGCWLQTSELAHTWRLDLSGGWEGYLQSLSRTQRRQTRNIVNRFDKNEALTVSHARSGQAAQTALDHCMELHQRRWNASGEIGCFFDGRFRKFVQQACLALADRGQLDVILLADQGKPIAG